jgi:hypothetical protein
VTRLLGAPRLAMERSMVTMGGIDGSSASKVEAMIINVDTAQIPTLSVSSYSHKQIYSALLNDTSGISLLSSEPTATSDVTTSKHAGKNDPLALRKTDNHTQFLQEKQLRSSTPLFFMACKAQ